MTWHRYIIAALLSLVLPAQAQPASAPAAAASAPEPTPNSKCGAGGYGYSTAANQWLERTAANGPGWRVDAAGRWVECDRPCVPAGTDPTAMRVWSEGPHQCTSATKYASAPDHPGRNRVLLHGTVGAWQQWLGPMRGWLVEECRDGQRIVRQSTCAPATHCATSWHQDGMVYDGRPPGAAVPLGGYVTARAPDGLSVRLRCVEGNFEAAPQCGPQTVARSWNVEVRTFRYFGPPVDPGQQVRAEQVSVRKRDGTVITDPAQWTNRIRWTLATCSAVGRLQ